MSQPAPWLRTSHLRNACLTAILMFEAGLTGCAYGGSGSPELHYSKFETDAPRGNTVTVCSAHGCRHKSTFTFKSRDLAKIREIMTAAGGNSDSAGERRAVRKAIAWIEDRVGKETGTSADRAGLDFLGGGDPTQMDCVDEATNTTSYLSVLAANGLLRYHEVLEPMAKDVPLFQWTHYFAVIRDKTTGQRWAVDSFMASNGREPMIVEAEKWYVRT